MFTASLIRIEDNTPVTDLSTANTYPTLEEAIIKGILAAHPHHKAVDIYCHETATTIAYITRHIFSRILHADQDGSTPLETLKELTTHNPNTYTTFRLYYTGVKK